jgi:hypothetical protein
MSEMIDWETKVRRNWFWGRHRAWGIGHRVVFRVEKKIPLDGEAGGVPEKVILALEDVVMNLVVKRFRPLSIRFW